MKWTTANVKNPNYNGNHEIYVGTHTGSFKKLVPAYEQNPFAQQNLTELSNLDKNSGISALEFGNEEQSEILIGRGQTTVEIYALRGELIERAVDFDAAPVVGVARYEDNLVAGIVNGQIQRINLNTNAEESKLVFSAGDNMAHLRQCPAVRSIVATGGKERQNNLKVFDLAADGKQLFTSKNLPNDYLQLEVPVWDSDVGFIDGPHMLATCSRHGYVRFYDTRKQRRPVQCFATEDQMSFTTLVARGNYIYTGTTIGALKAFDIRRMKTFVHTYKGFTGGISDLHLDGTGKYLTSSSLDRYVRVHDADSTVLLYQCYVKSKATRVLIRETKEKLNTEEDGAASEEECQEVVQKVNKVGKNAEPMDEEYEDLFENMATICENEEGVVDNDDIDKIDDEASEAKTKTIMKAGKKRQSEVKALKNKKKKT